MAASRLDMFWAEATDVDTATESPTKSARESLFAYLMNCSICYVDFRPCNVFCVLAQRQCLAPKRALITLALTYRDFMSTRPSHACKIARVVGRAVRPTCS